MTNLSNQLADLAERVKDADRAAGEAERAGAEHALNAGTLLLEAKAAAAHGEWLPFLERAGMEKRKAQRLMQLADSGVNASSVTHLGGVMPTMAFLAAWKLPSAGEALFLSTAEEGDDDADQAPVAYLWREDGSEEVYSLAVLNSERTTTTNHPLPARIAIEGDRPVDPVLHWLDVHFPVPVDQWQIQTVSRRLVDVVVFGRAAA